MLEAADFTVSSLGARTVPSPLAFSTKRGDGLGNFILDETKVRVQIELRPDTPLREDLLFEKAGPRKSIYFDPERAKAAIVTCGGLCPGLNNVIPVSYTHLRAHET